MNRPLVTSLLAILVLGPSACATRQFVEEELQKRDTRLGELQTDLGQERVRVGDIGSRAEEALQRAGQAAGTSTQALGRAEDASGRAGQAMARSEEAMARSEEAHTRLSRLWATRNKRAVVETLVVTFSFGKSELGDRAQTALLDVVRQLKENPDLFVNLEGYTDDVGSAASNMRLSQRRAESVRRFMVEKGVDLHRIQSIGLGSIRGNGTLPPEQNRKVAVKVIAPTD